MLNHWLRGRTPPRSTEITVGGLVVEIDRKRIKNFYLRVDRSHGRVRVSAPCSADDDEVAAVVHRRTDWIKRQQARVAATPPRPRLRYVSGETHFLLGRPLRLEVVESAGRGNRVARVGSSLMLHVERRSRFDQRQRAICDWYREEIKLLVPELIARWQPVIGVLGRRVARSSGCGPVGVRATSVRGGSG